MFTLVILSLLITLSVTANRGTFSSAQRMSLAFQMAKPYTPGKPEKPKKPKHPARLLMAVVKYAGTGAVAISGKIGGTVFTNSGSQGAFMRNWAKPRNVRNAATQLVRGIFSGISSGFKSLTASQVSAWNEAAIEYKRKNVFGDIKSLKGNTAFQRVNNTITSVGAVTVTDPPAVITPDMLIDLIVSSVVTAGTPTFTMILQDFMGNLTIPANTYLKVYGTTQRPVSQSFFSKSDYRLFMIGQPTDSINPFDLLTDYTAKFGSLVAGSKIGLAFESVTTDGTHFGLSGKFYTEVIVGA